MRKIVSVIIFAALTMWTTSYAEEKLLITDVLEKGEVETKASFQYEHVPEHLDLVDTTGSRKTDLLRFEYVINMGLGHGLEVGAGIPYAISDRSRVRFHAIGLEPQYSRKSGFGDIEVGAKYRIFDENDKPFALVAGLDIKLETASEGKWGTGSTNVSPFVAASTTVGQSVKPYAAYTATIRNHDKADTHAVILGAEKELNERVAIDSFLKSSFVTSTDRLSSYENYLFVVKSYIHVYRNLYAIPAVGVGVFSSSDRKDVAIHFDSLTEVAVGFSLYYLF